MSTLSKERDFIIASSFSPYLSSTSHRPSWRGRGEGRRLDWDYILKESIRHGVAPLIYDNLKDIDSPVFNTGSLQVPKKVLSSFEGIYHATAYKTVTLIEESKRIIRALNEKGINAVPIKGASLAEKIYKNIALRPFKDIDLLIRKADLPGARMVLEDLGFRSPSYLLPDSFYLRNHFNIPFIKHGPIKTYLEIHWGFTDRYMLYTPDMEAVWSEVPSGRETSAYLSIEDELVYLAMHLEMHGYLNKAFLRFTQDRAGDGKVKEFVLDPISENRLIWFVDLCLMLNAYRDKLNWDRIFEKSALWGARESLLSALSILRSLGLENGIPDINHLRSRLLRRPDIIGTPRNDEIKCHCELQVKQSRFLSLNLVFYKLITGKRGSKFIRLLLKKGSKTQFRPIRLFDLLRYYFPPSDYIRRYYKVGQVATCPYWTYHSLKGIGKNISDAMVLIFYSGKNLRTRFIHLILNRKVISLLLDMVQKKRIASLITPEGKITIEMADTRIKRILGLSFRKTLKDTKGMIFIFPEERRYPFQTANMKFPIDILYLDSSMKVVSIHPDIKPSKDPVVPLRNGRYVLEIPSGAARDYGITLGSHLRLLLSD